MTQEPNALKAKHERARRSLSFLENGRAGDHSQLRCSRASPHSCAALFVVMGLTLPTLATVVRLVSEKEAHVTSAMTSIGVPSGVYWTSFWARKRLHRLNAPAVLHSPHTWHVTVGCSCTYAHAHALVNALQMHRHMLLACVRASAESHGWQEMRVAESFSLSIVTALLMYVGGLVSRVPLFVNTDGERGARASASWSRVGLARASVASGEREGVCATPVDCLRWLVQAA